MANLPTKSRVWELANFVSGVPTTTGDNPTFALKTYDLPPLGADQILVKTLYMSNDPAIRVWIQGGVPQEKRFVNLEIGQVMPANGLAKVIASTSDNIKEGDIIRSWFGWREYSVLAAGAGVEVVRPIPGLDEAHFLGALGITGTAAYYGLFEIAKAKKGERIVVSGAAGATGSMAVQIAKKLIGAESVIGIAGSEEKCRWVESLGADKCLNYNSPSFQDDLKEATQDGVDVYFDNVAGETLNLVLGRMSLNGRVAACGAISSYNTDGTLTNNIGNWMNIVVMRLKITGFNYVDFSPEETGKACNLLQDAIADGTVKVTESQTIVEGTIEDVPGTWVKLFEGQSTGKLLTKFV